jgi:single-stranded-DNA-specific exonuclease
MGDRDKDKDKYRDDELNNNLFHNSQILLNQIEQKKDIFIFTNSTVDGIISGSIIFNAIFNNGGHATLRCINQDEMGDRKIAIQVEEIVNGKHDYLIFLDFSFKAMENFKNVLSNENCLVVNIDPAVNESMQKIHHIANPFLHSNNRVDEISSSGLAYLLIKNIDRNITDKSFLPVIAALSKDQDIGESRSFVGMNKEILDTAISLNQIEQKKGLTISEIDSSPVTDVIKNNIIHYIKDITWNSDICIEIAKDSGITWRRDGNAKRFEECSEDDFIKLADSMEKFLDSKSKIKINYKIKDILLGYNYYLSYEEKGFLKNARSFAKVIDSCIINKKQGLAFAVCLGDRSNTLNDIFDQIISYNNQIKRISTQIFGEIWRFQADQYCVFINGEGVLDYSNIKPFISFLERSISFSDKVICIRMMENEEYYKFLIIKTKFCRFPLNLIEEKMMERSNIQNIETKGKNLLEVKVPVTNLEDFLSNIKKRITNANSWF